MQCIFMLTWAHLKRCTEKHDDLAVCLKESYFDPSPIIVNTLLYLEEIIGIDHNKNSINVYQLLHQWVWINQIIPCIQNWTKVKCWTWINHNQIWMKESRSLILQQWYSALSTSSHSFFSISQSSKSRLRISMIHISYVFGLTYEI